MQNNVAATHNAYKGKIVHCEINEPTVLKQIIETLANMLHDTSISFLYNQTTIKSVPQKDLKKMINKETKKIKKKNKKDSQNNKKNKKDDSSTSEDSDENTDGNDDSDDDKKKIKPKSKGKKKDDSSESDENSSDESEGSDDDVASPVEDTSGIEIINLTERQNMIIYVKLKGNKIPNFYCSKPRHDIGISLTELHKHLKMIERDNIITLSIDEDNANYLNIKVNNDQMHKKLMFSIGLLDKNIKKYNLNSPEWTACVIMKCSEFHKVCKELHGLTDFVQITCTRDEISFSCFGGVSKTVTVVTYTNQKDKYRDSRGGVKIIFPTNNANEQIIRNVYELKDLMSFNKCSNICNDIKIFLKHQRPIFIEYVISSLGKLLIGLSPVEKKSVMKEEDIATNSATIGEDTFTEREVKYKI